MDRAIWEIGLMVETHFVMKLASTILLNFSICVLPSVLNAQEYETPEFVEGDSSIPIIFACMFFGDVTGLNKNAPSLGTDMLLESGVAPEEFDSWADDAVVYVTQELRDRDPNQFWFENCDTPFQNLEKAYGRN